MNRNDDLLNQALKKEQAGCRKDDTQCCGKFKKPTYEELEAQLKQLAAQLELSVAAERAWETTMMRVCGEDGPLSVAGKFNQLAAESAALKAFGDKLNDMHNDLNGEGTGIQGRAEVACQQVAIEAAMEEFDAIKTPATDTILACLRAEGVEMFAESQKAYVRDNRNSLDAMNRAAYCGSALDAERFAAQLRSKSEVQS